MSETEDFRAVTGGDEASVIEEETVSEGLIDESNVSGREESAKEESYERDAELRERQRKEEEEREEEEERRRREEQRRSAAAAEWEKKEAPKSADASSAASTHTQTTATSTDRTDRTDRTGTTGRTGTSTSATTATTTATTPLTDGADPASSPELAADSSDAKRQDHANATGPGVGERRERRTELADGGRASGDKSAVGEWNSLPVLVERLRAALELSLGSGSVPGRRRTSGNDYPLPEDSGIDSEEDQRIRNSMELAAVAGDQGLKNDLKFLEDLLLSDIETALSRLRETLERIDVNALTRHGAASDPSSKLQLLRLVSSLLSRLQVPQAEQLPTSPQIQQTVHQPVQQTIQQTVPEPNSPAILPTTRRRSRTRHTIGVSAEELASARRWLEEERSLQADLAKAVVEAAANVSRKEEFSPCVNGIVSIEKIEKLAEEVHDKDKKDAINHRQSLLDKTKDCRVEIIDNREVSRAPQQEIVSIPVTIPETDMNRFARRPSVGSISDPREDEENSGVNEAMEEMSRVGKLAAALRQRAELAYGGKCANFNNNNNKFMTKRTKIKRANTIDIPSYLKMQAESLGRDGAGCVSLRRPINVSDKASTGGNYIVPSFQPKTENDRKFLALINKNSDAPSTNAPPPFKTFGYTKATDLSAVTNENWTSRFSNMKTAFEKTKSPEKSDNNPIQSSRPERRPSGGVPHASHKYQNAVKEKPFTESSYICNGASTGHVNSSNLGSVGFRHAPSSPFRKIEKAAQQSAPIKPMPTWPKNNGPAPGNTLREKARMMFDREKNPPQYSQYQARQKFESDNTTEKNTFSRPPWTEHDRNEGKINGTAVENGKIDYRTFCKQFAPFVGRNPSTDTKAREFEQWRQREARQHQAILHGNSKDAIHDKHSGVVEGKISFKAIPDKRAIVQQERRDHADKRGKKFGVAMTDAFDSATMPKRDEPEFPKTNYDATLHGSATVAVQTGYNDDVPNEVRSFRVAPKISHGTPSTCSNASVQTSNDMHRITPETQPKSPVYDYHESDRTNANYHQQTSRQFADQSQNYHNESKDARTRIEHPVQDPRYQNEHGINEQIYKVPGQVPLAQNSYATPKYEERSYEQGTDFDGYHGTVPSYDTSRYIQPETDATSPYYNPIDPTWNENTFTDDEHIANQDISPDMGVVTRYTCAIATVASSVDSPEPKSEEGLGPSISQSSSTPSPLSQSFSQSRPATNEQALSEDEEIRRHNMLQQSLIRRLQKSSGSRTDQHADQPPISVSSQSFYSQSSDVRQPTKFLSPTPRKAEPQPPQVVIPSSGASVANRVTALREAYEQPAPTVSKPIQKERSPVPNGINPIDTSDEYLVSCANKSSRSIVLSKSESWHQLAQTNNSLKVPRTTTASVSPPQLLPKPPKPKSPSSLKLRHKQYEASSAADSVKKMEDKIRRYFDSPNDSVVDTRDSRHNKRLSPRGQRKSMLGLSRSQTMPGIYEEKPKLKIPAQPTSQLMNLNTADVEKVFDDLFEEATRSDDFY